MLPAVALRMSAGAWGSGEGGSPGTWADQAQALPPLWTCGAWSADSETGWAVTEGRTWETSCDDAQEPKELCLLFGGGGGCRD